MGGRLKVPQQTPLAVLFANVSTGSQLLHIPVGTMKLR